MSFNNITNKHDLECLPNKVGLQNSGFFVLRALWIYEVTKIMKNSNHC